MVPTTFWEEIKDFIFEPYRKLEYYFAKKWLDKNFGEQEYWGEYLDEKLKEKVEKNNKSMTIQTYLEETEKEFEDKFSVMLERAGRESEISELWDKRLVDFLHERQIGLVEVVKSEIDLPLLKRILGYLSLSNFSVQPIHLSESAKLRQLADETELREADMLRFSQILKNLELTNK